METISCASTSPSINFSSLKIKSYVNPTNYPSLNKRVEELTGDFETFNIRDSMHSLYYIKCGELQLQHKSILEKIDDPNSEISLEFIEWPVSDKYLGLFSEEWLLHFFNTNASIDEIYQAVQEACSNNFNPLDLDAQASSLKCWQDNHISEEESKKYAIALNFYTGTMAEDANRVLALEISEAFLKGHMFKIFYNNYHIIASYIIKALSSIPSYWGFCTRCIDLRFSDLEDYDKGTAITWIQFSSSIKGKNPQSPLTQRNTYFYIYSLTGKHISNYTNSPQKDEILFGPFSHFMVYKRKFKNNKNLIYLRQIEFGIGIKNILWVDDHIFDKNWENKKLMDNVVLMNKNIKFIPKNSTSTALAYLKSFWGRKKNHIGSDDFRIITDMKRVGEDNPNEAGALLIKQILELGFACPIMVFTFNDKDAEKKLNKYGCVANNILVTSKTREARNFMLFS